MMYNIYISYLIKGSFNYLYLYVNKQQCYQKVMVVVLMIVSKMFKIKLDFKVFK